MSPGNPDPWCCSLLGQAVAFPPRWDKRASEQEGLCQLPTGSESDWSLDTSAAGTLRATVAGLGVWTLTVECFTF